MNVCDEILADDVVRCDSHKTSTHLATKTSDVTSVASPGSTYHRCDDDVTSGVGTFPLYATHDADVGHVSSPSWLDVESSVDGYYWRHCQLSYAAVYAWRLFAWALTTLRNVDPTRTDVERWGSSHDDDCVREDARVLTQNNGDRSARRFHPYLL